MVCFGLGYVVAMSCSPWAALHIRSSLVPKIVYLCSFLFFGIVSYIAVLYAPLLSGLLSTKLRKQVRSLGKFANKSIFLGEICFVCHVSAGYVSFQLCLHPTQSQLQ